MIYTSESAALAALELLVHLGRSRSLSEYVIFSCTFAESMVRYVDAGQLPSDWRAYPAPASLKVLGDEWIENGVSAVLCVPSAVIEVERNYLLNVRHRDFHRVAISRPQRFELDLRLLPQ